MWVQQIFGQSILNKVLRINIGVLDMHKRHYFSFISLTNEAVIRNERLCDACKRSTEMAFTHDVMNSRYPGISLLTLPGHVDSKRCCQSYPILYRVWKA